VSALELTRYMRNQLLRDSDVMSMASSLELRVPFVDERFVDAIASIPASARLRPGKQLLLDAVPEIPSWIKSRPKTGFVFPFEQWLKADWSDFLQKIDRRSPVPLFTWYRRWALLALENFLRKTGIECPGFHR
jgi:asparagine synthase (glutamine-hydrolysing)